MRIPIEELQQELERVLKKKGMDSDKASACARLFVETDRDGVYSHGLNRFPRFLEYIAKGYVKVNAEPKRVAGFGALEQWDGQQGPGNLNAQQAMAQAIGLAKAHGIGGVGLRNTNHWMRGGSYGWQAAEAGCIGICFTNTMPNMPPWGGTTPAIGNNPFIMAVPRQNNQHVVLDMALSQFSYGKMEVTDQQGRRLPVPGGYDTKGNLTQDPAEILFSRRVLPVGFWKGSGFSMVLDMVAGLLSGGATTSDIAGLPDETNLSQVFICLEISKMNNNTFADDLINQVIDFTKSSSPVEPDADIFYPGERTLLTREENLRLGIPVNKVVWEQVRAL